MAERVQQPLAPVTGESTSQPDERVPMQGGPNLEQFRAMLAAIQKLDEKDRAEMAVAINEALIKMRAPGNDKAEAALILKELDLKSFTGLTDRLDRNCRKEAVETLMVMGFPHALGLSPEDFEYARNYVGARLPWGPRYAKAVARRVWLTAGLGLLGNAALIAAALMSRSPESPEYVYTALMYAGTPSLLALLVLLRGVRTQKSAMNVAMGMTFGALGSLVAAFATWPTGLIGTAILGAAAFLSYRLQNDFDTWDEA